LVVHWNGSIERPNLVCRGLVFWTVYSTEREMCPWAISKYFGDLVSNTSA
jgi:hypothetical protein